MRSRSRRWVKTVADGDFNFEPKLVIGSKTYTSITAPQITRRLQSSPFALGECNAATMTVSILTDDTISSSQAVKVMGRVVGEPWASEWITFGTFWIDTISRTSDGLVKLECYDAMMQANQAFVTGTSDLVNWPKSMTSVVSTIAGRMGVEVDSRTSIPADYVCTSPEDDTTMADMLADIAECLGGNWTITEDNKLRLVPLVTVPSSKIHRIKREPITLKLSDGRSVRFINQNINDLGEDTATTAVTHIQDSSGKYIITYDGYYVDRDSGGSYSRSDGLAYVPVVCSALSTGYTLTCTGITATDSDGNEFSYGKSTGVQIEIDGNPYMTDDICSALYTMLNGMTYMPYTASGAVFDPCAELGDQVVIGTQVYSVLYEITLDLNTSLRITIAAENSDTLASQYPYRTVQAQLDSATAASVKSFAKVNASIELLSNQITLEVNSVKTSLTTYVDDSLKSYATSESVTSAIQLATDSLSGAIESVKSEAKQYTDDALGEYTETVTKTVNSAIKLTTDSFNSTISSTKTELTEYVDTALASYSTTTQMQSAIDQKADSITLSVSQTYATQTDLSDYTKSGTVRSSFASETSSISVSSGSVTFKTGTLIIDSTNFKLTSAGAVTITGSITGKSSININSKTLYINTSGKMGTTGTVGGNTGLYKGASTTVSLVQKVSSILGIISYDLLKLWFVNGLYIGATDPSWIFSDGGSISTWSGS